MFEDTYFLDADEALRVAKQQNMRDLHTLQICYYNGEKIDTNLVNLVYAPIENIVDTLALGTYRLPTKLSFGNLNISETFKKEIIEYYKQSLEQAQSMRKELNMHYFKSLISSKLDFKEPLRVYLSASVFTRVMQNISKNIVLAFESMGYEVCFDLDYGMRDLSCHKTLKEFNPHVKISINHLDNHFIGNDVFNIVWIQDSFAIEQFKDTSLRKRDLILHLTESLNNRLKDLGVISSYQPFCVNQAIYKQRSETIREKKIVFIGSSYKKSYDKINKAVKHDACSEILQYYKTKGYIQLDKRKYYWDKYPQLTPEEMGIIFNYVERDLLLKEIFKLNLKYGIELYGYEWETDDELKRFSKGILAYGEEISKVYNSAKYALVIGGYTLQQRTLEAAASGAIPLVFDVRDNSDDVESECFNKSMIFFKRPADLPEVLKKEEAKEPESLVEKYSYENFAKSILMKIESTL